MVSAEHWQAAIAALEAVANDEREPERYRECYRAALETFRAEVPPRHVTHKLDSISIPTVGPYVAGALTRHVTRKEAIFCHGCELYVEQPAGQADVGAAVKQWEASQR